MTVPKPDEMYEALIDAINQLGGSASISEMEAKVAEILELGEQDLAQIHRGTRTKFNYRLAWTRNHLKRAGILENSSRGVWSLTEKGLKNTKITPNEVVDLIKSSQEIKASSLEEEIDEEKDSQLWTEILLEKLLSISPDAFERLCQRILRESGFIEVKVTGKSGDGGIDGRGILRLAGLIGFRIVFQCKRWRNNVSSNEIRDFRGAVDGRADKGLFITTSKFTRDAINEASREGAFQIDLIDGETLCQKIKELGLGVSVSTKEEVEVKEDWFDKL